MTEKELYTLLASAEDIMVGVSVAELEFLYLPYSDGDDQFMAIKDALYAVTGSVCKYNKKIEDALALLHGHHIIKSLEEEAS